MGKFSFQEDVSYEPDEPDGEYPWRFRKLNSEETQVVHADTIDDAWKGIRYYKGDEWKEWVLVGRDDFIRASGRVLEVSVQFAKRNKSLVEKWDEADEDD